MIHVDAKAAKKAVESATSVCKAFGIDALISPEDYHPDGTELRPYLSFDEARAAHPDAPVRLIGYAHVGQAPVARPATAEYAKTDKFVQTGEPFTISHPKA
jgi:hypothetical protein